MSPNSSRSRARKGEVLCLTNAFTSNEGAKAITPCAEVVQVGPAPLSLHRRKRSSAQRNLPRVLGHTWREFARPLSANRISGESPRSTGEEFRTARAKESTAWLIHTRTSSRTTKL